MDAIIDKMNYSVKKRKFDFREGRKEIALERLLYVESKLHILEFHVMESDMKVKNVVRYKAILTNGVELSILKARYGMPIIREESVSTAV